MTFILLFPDVRSL